MYVPQVSERAKGHCMARALTPMEILMEEIRTPPILRRVHNTMSDTEVVNNKKKLLPSPDLVADLSDEVSSYYYYRMGDYFRGFKFLWFGKLNDFVGLYFHSI